MSKPRTNPPKMAVDKGSFEVNAQKPSMPRRPATPRMGTHKVTAPQATEAREHKAERIKAAATTAVGVLVMAVSTEAQFVHGAVNKTLLAVAGLGIALQDSVNALTDGHPLEWFEGRIARLVDQPPHVDELAHQPFVDPDHVTVMQDVLASARVARPALEQ